MVTHARANSPYYRGLYRGLPERVEDPALLPPTSKKALMARFDDWATDRGVTSERARAFVEDPDLVGERFLGRYAGRCVNTHPALSPSFPGTRGPADALEYGVKVTGATLFLVDAGVDTGPIVAQTAVPVLDGDDDGHIEHADIFDSAMTLAREIWSKGSLEAGVFAHNQAEWYVQEVMQEAEEIEGGCKTHYVDWRVAPLAAETTVSGAEAVIQPNGLAAAPASAPAAVKAALPPHRSPCSSAGWGR